jgi:hypothetical protein
MSRHSYISTSFWDDEWVCSLSPKEKLLYLYLISNPLTNIAGVYKIIDGRICFDTGLSAKEMKLAMSRFEEAGKAYRMDEYIVIPTFPKHQSWDTSPRIRQGIIELLVDIGVDHLVKLEEYGYRFDLKIVFEMLSLPYPYPIRPDKEVPEPQQDTETDPIQVSVQTIIDQAALTGFCLDKGDAQRLLECTDPAWFGRHSFISFAAIKIREHKRYGNKPPEEQRNIFRTVIFNAENYRREYPLWREKQERRDREEAQAAEREHIRQTPPTHCQCGAALGKNQYCPVCGGFYRFDTGPPPKWVYCEAPDPSMFEDFGKS